MATLKQRLHRKNGTSYDTIHLETNVTVVKMSTTDDTTVSNKLTTVDNSINSLNTEMNSLKSSVSSEKAQIASVITDKGVSTSVSDSFSQMATNINQIKTGINGVPVYGTGFTYTGNYQIISEDDSGNWKIKFLISGTFTAMNDVLIVIFAVCGGSGGLSIGGSSNSSLAAGSGGGSGYTKTSKNILAVKNTSYSIVIGDGGDAPYGASYESKSGYDGNNGGNTSGFNVTAGGGGGGNHITQFSGGLTYTFPAAGKGGSGILVIRNAR